MILCREAECAIRINSFLRTLERPKVSNVRPSALECVQCDNWWNIHIVLSLAYETLSNPSSKFMYDLSKPGQYPIGGVGSPFVRTNGDHPNETLQRVLHQLFMEMMDGEFQTMRAFIRKYIYTSTWYLFLHIRCTQTHWMKQILVCISAKTPSSRSNSRSGKCANCCYVSFFFYRSFAKKIFCSHCEAKLHAHTTR